MGDGEETHPCHLVDIEHERLLAKVGLDHLAGPLETNGGKQLSFYHVVEGGPYISRQTGISWSKGGNRSYPSARR